MDTYVEGEDYVEELIDEDLIVSLSELSERLNECHQDVDDIRRVYDTAVAVEHLIASIEAMPVIDEAQRHAIQAGAEAIYAGTSYSAETLFPGIESHTPGTAISTESARTFALNVWKRLVELIESFLKRLKNYWTQFDAAHAYANFTIRRLERMSNSIKGRALSQPMVVMGGNVEALRVGRRLIKDGLMLSQNLDVLNVVASYLTNPYVDALKSSATAMNKALGSARSGNDLNVQVLASFDAMRFATMPASIGMKQDTSGRFGRQATWATPALLGRRTLYLVEPDKSGSVNDQLRSLRRAGLYYQPSTDEVPARVKSLTLPAANSDQVNAIVSKLAVLLSILEEPRKRGTLRDLEALQRQLAGSLKKRRDQDASQGDNVNEALRAAGTFVRWINTPLLGFSSRSLSVLFAASAYCAKSINAHR